MPAHEDDGQAVVTLSQDLLYIKSADVGHLQIEDEASWSRRNLLSEKLSRGCISLDVVTVGTQQAADRTPHARIVVDEKMAEFIPLTHSNNKGGLIQRGETTMA